MFRGRGFEKFMMCALVCSVLFFRGRYNTAIGADKWVQSNLLIDAVSSLYCGFLSHGINCFPMEKSASQGIQQQKPYEYIISYCLTFCSITYFTSFVSFALTIRSHVPLFIWSLCLSIINVVLHCAVLCCVLATAGVRGFIITQIEVLTGRCSDDMMLNFTSVWQLFLKYFI